MSRYLIAALVLGLVLALWRIDSVSAARDQASTRADDAEQRERGLQQVLDDERAISKTQADIDTAYQKGITDAQDQLNSTLSDLRADVIRLRVAGGGQQPRQCGDGAGGARRAAAHRNSSAGASCVVAQASHATSVGPTAMSTSFHAAPSRRSSAAHRSDTAPACAASCRSVPA